MKNEINMVGDLFVTKQIDIANPSSNLFEIQRAIVCTGLTLATRP